MEAPVTRFEGQHIAELEEQLAQAALKRDHLTLRSLVQDLIRAKTDSGKLPHPNITDMLLLVISTALTELLAQRNNQAPPARRLPAHPFPSVIPPYLSTQAADVIIPRLKFVTIEQMSKSITGETK